MKANKLHLTIYIFLTIVFFGSIYLKASDIEWSTEPSQNTPKSSVLVTNH